MGLRELLSGSSGAGASDESAAARPAPRLDAKEQQAATTARLSGRPAATELLGATRPSWDPAPKQRVEARPDTSERALRQTAVRDKALRRTLTTDEWGQLSTAQQNAVTLNTDLLGAYDADQAEKVGGGDRRNSKALLSQLGLDDELEQRLGDQLGISVGPAVRYDDLFGKDGVALTPNTTPAQHGGPTPGTLVRAGDERTKLINSLTQNLSAYLTTTAPTRNQGELDKALTQEYSFDSPLAKDDYETTFSYMLNRDALGNRTWSEVAARFAENGYDPADFQKYARDRLQLLPTTSTYTSLQELDSWFSS